MVLLLAKLSSNLWTLTFANNQQDLYHCPKKQLRKKKKNVMETRVLVFRILISYCYKTGVGPTSIPIRKRTKFCANVQHSMYYQPCFLIWLTILTMPLKPSLNLLRHR